MTRLAVGSQGADVRQLQELLNATMKPSPGLTVDGAFGPRTQAVVSMMQRTLGVPATGIADEALLAALRARVVNPASQAPAFPRTATWMSIAEGEVGQKENAAPGRQNARIVEYHATTTLGRQADEVPWCSSFVNWVIRKAGFKGTDNALASSWLRWGRELETPQPGAVTVIKRKGATSDAATGSSTGFHVAFFVSQTATHVRLLGGNQSDQVKFSDYPFSKYDVRGYRWPG